LPSGSPAGASPAFPGGYREPVASPPAWAPDPALQRFVGAYAGRRGLLTLEVRARLAAQAEPALRRVMPEVVAAQGPLAALDSLAGYALPPPPLYPPPGYQQQGYPLPPPPSI
jgi:hypothetical protein